MIYPWRVVIIVPADSRDDAEVAARAINSTGPNYEGQAFTLPLSSTGSNPPTHYGLYTSATDEMVALMASALPAVVGAMYWRHDVSGSLVSSNITQAEGQEWGWGESIQAASLRQIDSHLE